MTTKTSIQTTHEQSSESFELHARNVALELRSALSDGLASVNVESTKPQNLSQQLGLDKSLGWKVARMVTDDDVLAVASHMPGRAGLAIVQRSLARAGASDDSLKALDLAIRRFDQMVELHCGNRDTLEMMIGHLRRDGGGNGHDEALRKKAFQANSGIWGVRARARHSAHFVSPSAAKPELVDLAILSGLIDFRRLRNDVPWAVASVRRYSDDGSPITGEQYEPLDASVGPGEPPLVREFCSNPPPALRIAPGLPGIIRYEIVEGPVGNTAVSSCVTGWIIRADVPRFQTEHERFGEHLAALNTPAELSIHDLFVHRDLAAAMKPTIHLYSQLPGGPVYPQCGRDRGELPLREELIELGSGPPDLATPEIPRYRRLVQLAAERLGWTLNDFVGYRVKIRFPPIPTTFLFRHGLPERPA